MATRKSRHPPDESSTRAKVIGAAGGGQETCNRTAACHFPTTIPQLAPKKTLFFCYYKENEEFNFLFVYRKGKNYKSDDSRGERARALFFKEKKRKNNNNKTVRECGYLWDAFFSHTISSNSLLKTRTVSLFFLSKVFESSHQVIKITAATSPPSPTSSCSFLDS